MDALDVVNLIKEKGVSTALDHCLAFDEDISDPALRERMIAAKSAIQELLDYCISIPDDPTNDIRSHGEVRDTYKKGFTVREYLVCGMPHRTNGPAKYKVKGKKSWGKPELYGSWYLFGTTTEPAFVTSGLKACKIDRNKPCFNRQETIALALFMLKEHGEKKSYGRYVRRERILQFLKTMGELTLAATLEASCELKL